MSVARTGRAVTGTVVALVVALAAGCGVALSADSSAEPVGEPSLVGAPAAGEANGPASSPSSSAPVPTEPTPRPTAEPSPEAGPGTAAAALAALAVKGRAPMTGYGRERFGPAWLDADRNGCDTRNDLLGAHLTDATYEAGTNGCKVLSGTLADPFTGRSIAFVADGSVLVDIDHVVSLGNAWATGASRWDVLERAAFANDPLNLLPVDAGENRSKQDGDAATWLPPNKPFRCEYVARQVAVKHKYRLWVTAPEKQAIEGILAGCPGQPLTPDSGAPTRVDHDISDPGPSRPTASTATSPAPDTTIRGLAGGGSGDKARPGSTCAPGYDPCLPAYPPDVNCADVDGPVRVTGDDPHRLDGDGDGTACE